MNRSRPMAAAAIFAFLISPSSRAVTVEEAYRAIPHQRTIFDVHTSSMPSGESAYLADLFRVVDLAIVAKVDAAQGLDVKSAYTPVWAAWGKLHAPAKLQKIHALFHDAIENEQASLAAAGGQINASDPTAQKASSQLRDAYNQMMQLYPGENANNKQAFYDYPCALDFF